MGKPRIDLTNLNQQLIIAGMVGLIDDGLGFHEMMQVVEDIKRQTFPAMMEISRQRPEAPESTESAQTKAEADNA